MKIIYRISDTGYNKVKPDYIDNAKCLSNFCMTFPEQHASGDILVMADNVSDATRRMIQQHEVKIQHVKVGHGAGTFNLALDLALTYEDDEIVYFVENDYLHKPGSPEVLKQGFELGASFVSLYDHPDKYMDPSNGGNPYCEGSAEDTRVYTTETCHWKITNSTTMTLASKVKTLKRVENVLRKWTSDTHPHDFHMFIDLRDLGELLVTPIPGYSTHGETAWLAPFTDWSKI